MWVPNPPAASAAQRRYNRPAVLSRIRRSLALKLILASAIPSAVVLVTGLGALVAHSHRLAARPHFRRDDHRARRPALPRQAHPRPVARDGSRGAGRVPGPRPRPERG